MAEKEAEGAAGSLGNEMIGTKRILIGIVWAAALGIFLWHYWPKQGPIVESLEEPALSESDSSHLEAPENPMADAVQIQLRPEDVAIKSLSLSMPPKEFRAFLGSPASITDEPPFHDAISEKELPLKTWHYDGLAIIFLNGRAVQITASSRKWPTGKGLRVGDGLERVAALYGKPSEGRRDVYTQTNQLVYCLESEPMSFCPFAISISSHHLVVSITYDEWPD